MTPGLLRRADSSSSSRLAGLESEEGPLWSSIRKQLYRSEVSHVKRLVGEQLIQQNKLMWSEIAALRQILADFQEQNDQLTEGLKQQVQFRGSQHRELLRRQAQIILEDVRSQAESCGHVLEDLVPEMRDDRLRDFLLDCGKGERRPATPSTPSTQFSSRPSSASGVSRCSTPESGGLAAGAAPTLLPLGRRLDVDELSGLAAGIREALEAEQEALLAAIGEQLERLEAEDARRAESARREPSTAQLQGLVHKLQDIVMSPSLRTLVLTGPWSPAHRGGGGGGFPDFAEGPAQGAVAISGGGHVRRLQAYIAQRRRAAAAPLAVLGAVPESPSAAPTLAEYLGVPVNARAGPKPAFDPFFDDPFA